MIFFLTSIFELPYYMSKINIKHKYTYNKILIKPNQSKGWDGTPRVFI